MMKSDARLTVTIPLALRQRLKVEAVERGMTMGEVVAELLQAAGYGPQEPKGKEQDGSK